MSFQERNTVVSLVNFMLILVFFLVRLFQLNQNDNLTDNAVFALWGIVIFMAVIVTVVAIILANVAPLVVRAVQTGEKPNPIDHLEDERDKTIQLRGTQVTQTVLSLGSFVAMLTYAFGQPPLMMFTLLIFFGVLSQVVGDIFRLFLYRRGF